MRCAAAISAFALLLAVPLWAQHGGGHGGGGGHAGGSGHAGFGGGHGFAGGHGGFGAGHSSSGVHSYSGARSSARLHAFNRPGSTGPFLHDRFRRGFNRFGFRNRFRNGCWGYGCWAYGYPWWGYDPWWWDNDSGYDDSYEQDLANANAMNEQSLEQQQMFRQEEADGDQDAYAPRRSPSAQLGQGSASSAGSRQGVSIMPGTLLVFKDRHQEEVENYAIVGQTLWTFAPQHNQRIPLSDLDLTATAQANDDRGLTFRIPTAR